MTAPKVSLRLPAKLMMGAGAVLALPSLYLIVDDLSYRGDFLDGLMATFAGIFLGACVAVLVFGAASLTRATARWQTVWFVCASVVCAGVVGIALLMGFVFGSGG